MMKARVIDWLVVMLDWLMLVLVWIREGLHPTSATPIPEYQGGESILPELETLRLQPALVSALGNNEKKAIILQKIHEWCLYNQSKGTHVHDGATWTYGSYKDWHKLHFGWMSSRYLGNLLAELVADGFLFATNDAPFCYKGQFAYRVNSPKIKGLVGCQKVTHPMTKIDTPRVKNDQAGWQKSSPNNSSKTINSNKKTKTIQTTPPAARTHIHGDDGVDGPDHETGEFDTPGNYGESAHDDTARMEPVLEVDESPPDSAPPPSLLVSRLLRDMPGLTQKVAENMVEQYGDARCEAIADWIRKNGSGLRNPTGFWIDELRHNRMEIEVQVQDKADKNRYKSGKWADIINS